MSRLSNETRRSLIDIERALGCPQITWNGGNYVCTPHTNAVSRLLVAGGITPSGSTGFVVRSELFNSPTGIPVFPDYLQAVTGPDGSALKIMNITKSADGAFIFLDCASQDAHA